MKLIVVPELISSKLPLLLCIKLSGHTFKWNKIDRPQPNLLYYILCFVVVFIMNTYIAIQLNNVFSFQG